MATITFQNLFRIYNKLAGMTGTADTEASEFHSTYKLDVTVIPTNKSIIRSDAQDTVYKTEKEKFAAVTAEILERHGKGQPILVGTTSVEKSTAIAKLLTRKKIPHAVLNAKQHEKEAYVIAQAGRKGAITVSTNMAGRGTDIILGGSAEMLAKLEFKELGRDPDAEPEEFEKVVLRYEAECKKEGDEVRAVGGMHIVGTERHESRRIDNQLRGRAGRQGDPGSSRFFLSLEDDLMRIFGGDRVKQLMERMGMPDNEPIEHPWVTKSIGDAQGKVEARNFDIRKNVLEYDDVMNQQRKTVYKIRQQLLLGIYEPEKLDDDGKPTGKVREVKVPERLENEVKDTVLSMVLAHSVAKEGGGESADMRSLPRPTTIEEALRIDDLEALQADVYGVWGYKIDYKDGDAESPTAMHKRLVKEVASSLAQQRERLLDVIDSIIGAIVDESCPQNKPPEDWDWPTIKKACMDHFRIEVGDEIDQIHYVDEVARVIYGKAEEAVLAREKEMGTELLLRIFRHYYLSEIDKQWVEHLTNMEHLRDGIGLRGYGQRDPKQEYKKEGYDIFVTMMASTSANAISQVFEVQVKQETEIERLERTELERARKREQGMHLMHDGEDFSGGEMPSAPPPRRVARPSAPPVEREQECPCGSGQPFKSCHGAALEEEAAVGGEASTAAGEEASAATEEAPRTSSAAPKRMRLDPDEPCACGSGELFKDCHGKPEAEASAE